MKHIIILLLLVCLSSQEYLAFETTKA